MKFMKKSKVIIVFEGIDGSGKSTQARLLYFALRKKGVTVSLYHFPSDGIIGKFVRALLENGAFDRMGARARALLTASDFYSQYDDERENSDVVIFDRYFHSSYASNEELDRNWIRMIHKFGPEPTIVFFMDGNPRLIKRRGGIDIMATNEKRQMQFRHKYRKLFGELPNVTIDSNRSAAEIHAEVMNEISRKLRI